jgi:CRISPR-associated protein Cmr2
VAAAMFVKRLLETDRGQKELEAHLQTLKQDPPKGLGIPQKVDVGCIPHLARITPHATRRGIRDVLLQFDGDLLYTETFTENRIGEEFPEVPPAILKGGAADIDIAENELLELEPIYVAQQIAKAAGTLRALYRAVRDDKPENHILPPSKYFAVLAMDGDHMGRFFGKADRALAGDLSQRMSRFAREKVKTIVEDHFGRLVYAGGDDVLALLPLETALSCARALQAAFKDAVHDLTPPPGCEKPTPSAGIAIAHHTQPLDATLTAMRDAEKDAKNKYGRDALCVYVLKRSGEEVRVGTHWEHDGWQLVELVERTVKFLNDDILSMKFAHAVGDEARALTALSLPARESELKRLAKRHKGNKPKEDCAAALAAQLAAWAGVEHGDAPNKKPLGLEEVAWWIQVARFIASGGRDEE